MKEALETGEGGLEKKDILRENGESFKGQNSVSVSNGSSRKIYLSVGSKPQGWRNYGSALEGLLLYMILVKSAWSIL